MKINIISEIKRKYRSMYGCVLHEAFRKIILRETIMKKIVDTLHTKVKFTFIKNNNNFKL